MSQWNDHLEAMGSHLEEIKKALGPQEKEFEERYQQLSSAAAEASVDPKDMEQRLNQMYADFPVVGQFLKQADPKLFEIGPAEPPPEELATVQAIQNPPQEEVAPLVEKPPPAVTTSASTPAQVTPPVEIAQSKTESGLQIFKEIVTAVLAVTLVIFTLVMAYHTMNLAGDNNKISQAKDILMLLLGPFGTALGYYFGRLPADARAAQAQQQAAQAATQVEQVNAKAIQIAEQTEDLTGELQRAPGVRGTVTPAMEKVQHLRAETRELFRLARRR